MTETEIPNAYDRVGWTYASIFLFPNIAIYIRLLEIICEFFSRNGCPIFVEFRYL